MWNWSRIASVAAILVLAVAEEEPPPPPPAPLPPFPTVRYIFNVTRLNDGAPIITGNATLAGRRRHDAFDSGGLRRMGEGPDPPPSGGNASSAFTYNFHPAWVSPAGPDAKELYAPRRHEGVLLGGGSRHRLEEGAGLDGLLLQVQSQGSGVTQLALVSRAHVFPWGGSRRLDEDPPPPPPPVTPGPQAFDKPDKSKVVLSADGQDENWAVGSPSLLYCSEQGCGQEGEESYYLVYTAETRNNQTGRVHKQLHLATSDTPAAAGSWVRHGALFDTYPLNVSETEFGTLVAGNATYPGFLFFVTTYDDTGVFQGIQVATTDTDQYEQLANWRHVQNFTLLAPRSGQFDANGLIPGPAPMRLNQDGHLLYLYNGMKLRSGLAGAPWTFSVGWSVLNSSSPTEVMWRGSTPLLSPMQDWERVGRVPNSVVLSGLARDSSAEDPYWADVRSYSTTHGIDCLA